MNYYTVGSIIGGSIGLYFGYDYIKAGFNKYILPKIMNQVISHMNHGNTVDSEAPSFVPFHRQKSAMVMFKDGGKTYNVCIPYDRSKFTSMNRKKVYLIKKEIQPETQSEIGSEKDIETDITHKPGIPYLLSAIDLGGDYIIVKKDNQVIKKYEGDTIPEFLE